MIKISICIPTWNRGRYLNTLLASIHHEARALNRVVFEVVVSDNASSDNTQEIMSNWSKDLPIIYSRNEVNVGPDRNYFLAAKHATGEYIWFMGSDDELEAGSLNLVSDAIVANPRSDIHLFNRENCTLDMRPYKKSSWAKAKDQEIIGIGGIAFDEYLAGCQDLGGVFSYLSSIVVRRDKFLSVAVPDFYWESAYSHVYPLLHLMVTDGQMTYHKKSCVLCRIGNDHFSSQGFARRILIDLEGYKALSESFASHPIVSKKLLVVLRRHISFFNLSRAFSHSIKQSKDSAEHFRFTLLACRYSMREVNVLFLLAAYCGVIIDFWFGLKGRIFAFLTRKIKQ
jgi:abequosyltransferase